MTNRSPLDAEHRALGAHMGAFAGWEMPISYAGTVSEHTAVRTAAGVFDVSHLGKIWLMGEGARELLERALTNRMLDLAEGRARYTLMLDEDGGIVDDMIVYGFPGMVLVVPNASNVDEVERRLRATQGGDGAGIRRGDEAIIALQGPRSRELLDRILPGVQELGYMHCAFAQPYVICRSGYTGEHGYEIFARPDDAPVLWKSIIEAGVVPCGLAARDTLRLEMGYPLHGNDIDRDTTPAEAGLMWAVSKDKRSSVSEPRKRLVGIRMSDRIIPRHGCTVLRDGTPVGECTSGTFSPTLKIGIALAYVAPAVAESGGDVQVDVRGKTGTGKIVDPPFVESSPKD